MATPDLRLDWCPLGLARHAVLNWHYSRRWPTGRTQRIGVWEAGRFVGCVVFGDSANRHVFTPFGITEREGTELRRVALREHGAPVSRMLRIAVRLLVQRFPVLRLLISFADPDHGHHGGIYQASGWVYAGLTGQSDEYVVNGRRLHGKVLRKTRKYSVLPRVPARNALEWARQVLDPGAEAVAGSSKHRYLLPLDAAMRAQIAPLAKPYPRPARLESEAPGIPARNEGAAMRPLGSEQILLPWLEGIA